MIQINKDGTVNAEVLKFQLQNRRCTRTRFRFPFTKEQTKVMLKVAIEAEVEYRHRKFELNDEFENQLEQIAEWFTTINAKFGLLFCGLCGNGKSTWIRSIQQLINQIQLKNDYDNSYWGMRILTAKDIAYLSKNDYQNWRKLSQIPMLAIDDLGYEPKEVLDFGNVLNPVIDLLTKRYDEQLFTMITTNLTTDAIREKYGDRIADRLKEMTKIIVFKNESYR